MTNTPHDTALRFAREPGDHQAKNIGGKLLRVERQIHDAQTWVQAVSAFNSAKRRLSATLRQRRMARNEGRKYDQTIVDRSMTMLIEATRKKAQLAGSRP